MRRIPEDHNYHTACPPAIKAKISALEHAAMNLASADGPAFARSASVEAAQVARYNLERVILTHLGQRDDMVDLMRKSLKKYDSDGDAKYLIAGLVLSIEMMTGGSK